MEKEMGRFLVSAVTLIALTSAVQADIICTVHGGCWETGKRLRDNGGVYRGLEFTVTLKNGQTVKRTLPYAADYPAASPAQRR
jgi:hypothetical protein